MLWTFGALLLQNDYSSPMWSDPDVSTSFATKNLSEGSDNTKKSLFACCECSEAQRTVTLAILGGGSFHLAEDSRELLCGTTHGA